eukprot:4990795-Pleurochrysis_carterae.AAC.3
MSRRKQHQLLLKAFNWQQSGSVMVAGPHPDQEFRCALDSAVARSVARSRSRRKHAQSVGIWRRTLHHQSMAGQTIRVQVQSGDGARGANVQSAAAAGPRSRLPYRHTQAQRGRYMRMHALSCARQLCAKAFTS